MGRGWLVTGLLTLVGLVGVSIGLRHAADARAQDDACSWASETAERVYLARQAIYPSDRPGASTRGAAEDAELLYALAVEQNDSQRPTEAEEINGDLVEAFTVAAAGLEAATTGATTGADPDTQLTFAKAIVYNADARLVLVAEGC